MRQRKGENENEKIRKSKMFGGEILPQQGEGSVALPKNLIDRGFGKFKGVIRLCKKDKE